MDEFCEVTERAFEYFLSGGMGDDSCADFSIAELHQALFPEKGVGYTAFRSALYGGNLNQRLAELGLKIEIASSTGKVDDSRYQLVHIGD
jgi:hypothetical protein